MNKNIGSAVPISALEVMKARAVENLQERHSNNFELLENSLTHLDKTLSDLQEKIGWILLPELPDQPCETEQIRPTRSPLNDHLRHQIKRIDRMIELVQRLTHRVDL